MTRFSENRRSSLSIHLLVFAVMLGHYAVPTNAQMVLLVRVRSNSPSNAAVIERAAERSTLITRQDVSVRHVRATEPKIVQLIDAGISGSATLHGLIAMLNQSDVIVYMGTKLAMTASLVAWPGHARTADDPTQVERQTLEAALLLAGVAADKLPITLASVKPDTASAGVQAWTTVGADGSSERIYIYSNSDLFRCARPSNENYQCVLKLASVIVHEAWHFRHGASETSAYDAQLAFLMGNQGALEQMTDVRRSRSQAVVAERKAVEAARKLSSTQAR